MSQEKNCWNCAYKRNIPGNAHISCHFNFKKAELLPPLASQHGIDKGWYMFPVNFDPRWQTEECKGHAQEVDKELYLKDHNPFLTLLSFFR